MSVPGGFVALEPMATKPDRPVPAAAAWCTCGGAGTTTAAMALAAPTHTDHRGGCRAWGGSGAFHGLGQPRYRPPGPVAVPRRLTGAGRKGS